MLRALQSAAIITNNTWKLLLHLRPENRVLTFSRFHHPAIKLKK